MEVFCFFYFSGSHVVNGKTCLYSIKVANSSKKMVFLGSMNNKMCISKHNFCRN
jgi:hypothetical protein